MPHRGRNPPADERPIVTLTAPATGTALSVADLPPATPTPWLVETFLHEGSLNAIAGRAGTGRSLVLLDLLCHIAAGKAWHGNAVVKRECLLITADPPEVLSGRVRAWLSEHPDVDAGDLALRFTTAHQGHPSTLGTAIASTGAQVVALDTFGAGGSGHLRLLRAVCEEQGTTIITMLSAGHATSTRAPDERDSDVIERVDTLLEVAWQGGNRVHVQAVKAKHHARARAPRLTICDHDGWPALTPERGATDAA